MTMGGLFYEVKSGIAVTASGLWSDRTSSFLLLAFVLFRFEPGEGTAAAGITFIYVASCLTGGFAAGKIMRKDRYLWGIITGLSYYVLLLIVSFMAQGKWDMTFAHAVTTFFMCLGGGALGGMLS